MTFRTWPGYFNPLGARPASISSFNEWPPPCWGFIYLALVVRATDRWAAEDVAATADPVSYDLVRDLAGLFALLMDRLRNGQQLDAFLAAAGMSQILEDYLHRDLGELKKAARHLRPLTGGPSALAAWAVASVAAVLQRAYPAIRDPELVCWQGRLAELVQNLADRVAGVRAADTDLMESAQELGRAMDGFSQRLRRSVIRLPACFATFDQQPADIERLVADCSERWPDRRRPLAVVGVRTSGSYLAPLAAAFLKRRGFRSVEVASWRPEQEWLSGERHRLSAVAQAGGLGLIVDDPPTSGRSLAGAASALGRVGFWHSQIILLFAAFKSLASWEWTNRLNGYQAVILPWDRWAIHDRLTPLAVRRTLSVLLTGQEVDVFAADGNAHIRVGAIGDLQRVPAPSSVGGHSAHHRGHVRALYRVELIEQGSGRAIDHYVYAKGIGLGYLGTASAAIADRLQEFIAPVYGARDGLLYRAWLPEPCRLDRTQPNDDRETAERMVSYVVKRARALRVPEPTGRRLVTEPACWGETVWQAAGQLVSPAFGRGAPMARVAMRRAMIELLSAPEAAIIDGKTDSARWFSVQNGAGRVLLKTGFADGAYRAGTVHCYDPAFDVAAAAVGKPDGFADLLRSAYTRQSVGSTSDERWLIYRLLATQDWWDKHAQPGADGRQEREMARVFQRYFGDLYLRDAEPSSGPICAIDIDGVLETPWLGFPSITPAGALALRALAMHGYRAVVVTGRSLDEVRERCLAYRLVGGVAEYGAVVYNHEIGRHTPMISTDDQRQLDTLRSVLTQFDGIHIDPAYRYAVRAYQIRLRRRFGLDPETIKEVLTTGGPGLIAIEGRAQTDFITASFDKGSGLQALARQLSADDVGGDGSVAALAVGDTSSDLPVFRQASLAFAPANADAGVRRESSARASLTIVRRPYQAGLLHAISIFLGHRAGGCPLCRDPSLSADARCLIGILTAQDAGRWEKVGLWWALAMRDRRAALALRAP